jgi:trehalose 6-phosphate phosphatase
LSRPLLSNLDSILPRVREAERVLLALDFDGTLSPIADRPEDAVVPHATAHRLAVLSQREDFSLVVLSGRSLPDLRIRLPVDCTFAGNHGLEIEGPGVSFVHPDAASLRPLLQEACARIQDVVARIEGAWVENKGLSATVHYRQVAPDRRSCVRVALENAMPPFAGSFDVLPARKAWEIRPRVEWDKGAALRFLLSHGEGPAPLVVCAGDDSGDEPMFDAVAGCISIRVGGEAATSARFFAASPAELTVFLGLLAADAGLQARAR